MWCGHGGLIDGKVCLWDPMEAQGGALLFVGALATDSGATMLCSYCLCCRATSSSTGSHLSASLQPPFSCSVLRVTWLGMMNRSTSTSFPCAGFGLSMLQHGAQPLPGAGPVPCVTWPYNGLVTCGVVCSVPPCIAFCIPALQHLGFSGMWNPKGFLLKDALGPFLQAYWSVVDGGASASATVILSFTLQQH